MKRLKFRYIFLGMLIVGTGCTKGFLDINKDPNNPAKVSLSQLLPTAEQGLSSSLGFTNDNAGVRGLTEVLAVYTHQMTVREDPDKYNATGTDFSIDNSWTNFWSGNPAQAPSSDVIGTMQNLEVMIAQATAGDNKIYAGIGKILKAYGVSQFVDAYGDVPYTEATKFGETGNRYPAFDKGSEVYPKLLALLDEAIADLQDNGAANTAVPEADDLFYGGKPALWISAAKTIKLKLYNQLRLVQDVSAPVNALITGGGLISSTANSFMMKYTSVSSPDSRNPGFADYVATQKSHYQSPWFYEILKGYNKQIFTGIVDPRVPYYFFNQLTPDGAPQNGTEYRDGGFVSIYFGSTGPNRDKSNDKSMSVAGIYPIGGRYDDGDAVAVSATNATGAAPLRLLTYADRLFIEAELINAKIIAGDAKAKLSAAIDASMAQVDYVVNLAKGAQAVPALGGTDEAVAYRDAILQAYDQAGTDARKLEIIITQKWIQSFGFSCDQYTDYRRTGYPVLFDPANPVQAPGGFAQPPINGDPIHPGAQAKVKVINGKKYPLSLPWPASEANVNPNTPPAKSPDVAPVFWDKN
ncbi:SusD/RagB family nutrient-binding outer membrane lipoprotein [Chitinophaga sp. MM2321]|uniref:SusD/RagB family nutrient-binding outer membrane lipoprotein n=1 Tax=Chitinophaga sp. MM2321 TaxID=3137178 RepID=UPI0032D5A08F